MTTALQAVLTFADNFTPAADNTRMLQNADGTAHIADEMMLYVHILHAFAPVFQVVTDYAFGKPENKLIQEISIRLMQRSATLRDDLFGAAATEAVRPQIDIVMIKLLCGLYAACHSAEMRRLVNLSDDERAHAVVTIDTVWEAFEKQAEMVSVVAGQIIPIVKADEGSASAGPALLEKSPASPPSGGGNPMAFFGKKKPEAAPAENPATPFRKPAPVAAEKKPGDGAANPMAFFAKKPKNATDGE